MRTSEAAEPRVCRWNGVLCSTCGAASAMAVRDRLSLCRPDLTTPEAQDQALRGHR